jgi:heme o synthase
MKGKALQSGAPFLYSGFRGEKQPDSRLAEPLFLDQGSVPLMSEPTPEPSLLKDILTLTKFRLSALVIVTTFVGFWLAHRGAMDWGLLFHTLFGSTLAAFGAAVFNQLMEIEPDSKMQRTADRPLPAGRISTPAAFGLGWLLSSWSLIHLVQKVNFEAAAITAATLFCYVFIYTPLKRQSETNTLVGAVSGALPPLIGWVAASGPALAGGPAFRWHLLVQPGAIYLFALLFLWQLPHFLAINWMYRDEYRRGGFVMLANEDAEGQRTALHSLAYAAATLGLMFYPVLAGAAAWWFLIPGLAVSGALSWRAWQFHQDRQRAKARSLFLFTLMYLPAALVISVLAWK